MAFELLAKALLMPRFFDDDSGTVTWYGHREHCVLTVLANRADAKGRCWPGYASISRSCFLSRRQVAKAVQNLKLLKLISVKPPTETRKTNTYWVSMERMQEVLKAIEDEPQIEDEDNDEP